MPDLNLNPHLTGDYLLICDGCAQLLTIRVELPTQMAVPRFCPWCAAPRLRSVKSTVRDQLKAVCFGSFDPQLIGLLYSAWRSDPAGFLSFVDYVQDQVDNAEV